MTPFRPLVDLLAQLWFSLDTANALRHGNPVSDRARAYCLADTSQVARPSSTPAPA